MAARPAHRAGPLLWADYRARHAHRRESPARAAILGLPRILGDPGMHAVVLLRVVCAAPPLLRGFAQRCLLWSHGMYVDPTAEIGPGVVIPHPIAITLGPSVKIGSGVALYQNVTVKAADVPRCGAPRIGDRVRVYTGAVISGPVEVGAGATVGAGTVVTADVPRGGRITRRHGAADGGDPILEVRAPPAGGPHQGLGLRELLAADHRARFGPAVRASSRRQLLDAVADRPLRVTAIVRIMQAGPPPLRRIWRRALLFHGCDIGFDARIGPGLSVPCPIGVCIGRRAAFGSSVALMEHTSAGPTKSSWEGTPTSQGLTLGDGVQLLPGAGAFGDAELSPGAIVRPWALVTRDAGDAVMEDGWACATAPDPAGSRVLWTTMAAPTGLELLRSDLDRVACDGIGGRVGAAFGLPFQAAVLMRAATSTRGRLARIGRVALRGLHHCYVDEGVRIGPGLLVPLPCGIRLERGVRLGAHVTVLDRVSLRSDRALGGAGAAAVVADGTVLGTGVVVLGGVLARGTVHDGAVLMARPRRTAS